jgi:hypothetical protein
MKWFLSEMFNPQGKISAPQVIGAIMCLFGCVLSACHYSLDIIVPIYSTGMALLGISGTVEVVKCKHL